VKLSRVSAAQSNNDHDTDEDTDTLIDAEINKPKKR